MTACLGYALSIIHAALMRLFGRRHLL